MNKYLQIMGILALSINVSVGAVMVPRSFVKDFERLRPVNISRMRQRIVNRFLPKDLTNMVEGYTTTSFDREAESKACLAYFTPGRELWVFVKATGLLYTHIPENELGIRNAEAVALAIDPSDTTIALAVDEKEWAFVKFFVLNNKNFKRGFPLKEKSFQKQPGVALGALKSFNFGSLEGDPSDAAIIYETGSFPVPTMNWYALRKSAEVRGEKTVKKYQEAQGTIARLKKSKGQRIRPGRGFSSAVGDLISGHHRQQRDEREYDEAVKRAAQIEAMLNPATRLTLKENSGASQPR